MKSIKQIRESYDLITEKEETENRKLATLVRAGLYDAKKLPALKKALDKSADKMTSQERRMLINLLDSLINQVIGNDQIYRRVKQNVQQMNEAKGDHLTKFDPRFPKSYPSEKKMPTVLILKRKAIRVYPDNQKVALYYSQALDKYVTIPFGNLQTGINESDLIQRSDIKEENQIQEALPLIPLAIAAGKVAAPHIARAASKYVPAIGRGIASAGRSALSKGKDLGKKAVEKYKQSKTDASKTRTLSAADKAAARRAKIDKFNKTVGKSKKRGNLLRTARRAGRFLAGVGGGGGLGGNTQNAANPNSSSKQNFTLKPSTKSSWENRTDNQASQRKRDERLARQTQTAMLKETSVLETLKSMVNENIQNQTIRFNEQEININNTVAKKIMHVYESVNVTNKKKMEKMLNESSSSFNKVLTFAIRQ